MARDRKIHVRGDVYELLIRLRDAAGLTSVSDTILLLADRARLCKGLSDRLDKLEALVARLAAEVEMLRRALERSQRF